MRLSGLWLLIGGLVFLLESPIRRLMRARHTIYLRRRRLGSKGNQDMRNHIDPDKQIRSPWCQHFAGDDNIIVEERPVTTPGHAEVPLMTDAGLSDSTIAFFGSQSGKSTRI